jgi:hypothetical protein
VERMDFYRPMVGLGDRPHRFYRAHPTCRWTNVMTMCTRPLQATDQQTTRPGGVGPARLTEMAGPGPLAGTLPKGPRQLPVTSSTTWGLGRAHPLSHRLHTAPTVPRVDRLCGALGIWGLGAGALGLGC